MNPLIAAVPMAVVIYCGIIATAYSLIRHRWAPIIREYKYVDNTVPGWWLGYWRFITFRYWATGAWLGRNPFK